MGENKRQHFLEKLFAAPDEPYKRQHPTRCRIAAGIAVTLGILPLVLCIALAFVLPDGAAGGWMIPLVLGALFLGAGIGNLALMPVKQDLGQIWTLAGIFFGAVPLLFSCLFLYVPSWGERIDQNVVNFHFTTWLFLLFPIAAYGTFRTGISVYLKKKRKLSENQADRLKEGFFNYWWYEKIHKTVGMGYRYGINKFATLLLAGALGGNLCFGLIKSATPAVGALCIAAHLLGAFLALYGSVQENLDRFKKPFRRIFPDTLKRGKWGDSLLFLAAIPTVELLIAYVELYLLKLIWFSSN